MLAQFVNSHAFICKHFDPSVDAGSRYYHQRSHGEVERVYGLNATTLNDEDIQPKVINSCIGESPGKKMDQCEFDGYLKYDELCNPCENKEFKEQCGELCATNWPPFGPFWLM